MNTNINIESKTNLMTPNSRKIKEVSELTGWSPSSILQALAVTPNNDNGNSNNDNKTNNIYNYNENNLNNENELNKNKNVDTVIDIDTCIDTDTSINSFNLDFQFDLNLNLNLNINGMNRNLNDHDSGSGSDKDSEDGLEYLYSQLGTGHKHRDGQYLLTEDVVEEDNDEVEVCKVDVKELETEMTIIDMCNDDISDNIDNIDSSDRCTLNGSDTNTRVVDSKYSTAQLQPLTNPPNTNSTANINLTINTTKTTNTQPMSNIPSYIQPYIEAAQLDSTLPNGWTLFEHQKEAIQSCLLLGKCILAYDMGLGKTIIGMCTGI